MTAITWERLAYKNRWTKHIIQPLEGVDCFQEAPLLNPENNLIVLNLSEAQFLKIYSSLFTGADICYPDESMQIMIDFLRGIACPPTIVPEECMDLPTYANNIAYLPANPYIEPDEIPDGYLMQPFLVNGQNGNVFVGYEDFDVIVPFGAITFDVNWFDDVAGQLPTIQVMVNGQGSVNLRMLCFPQGGLAVITLDNPPNIADIIVGIVTGAENIVDLNQDMVSLPPETAKEIIFPVAIETGGIHTIYIVFLPILDDSLIPLRFGGGFRGLELCGFLPEGDMGIQNLRFVSCNLEQQNSDGSWAIVTGWEDWLDCVPSGGGGGGSANLIAETHNVTLGTNITTTGAPYNRISAGEWSRTFTKSKAIVQLTILVSNSGANDTFVRPHIQQGATGIDGESLTNARMNGSTPRTIVVTDVFVGIVAGSADCEIAWGVSGGTGTIHQVFDVEWVVIEFDDVSELFVEDIRIQSGQLQKKIGGAWLDVSESFAAIISGLQTGINNAAAAANAAQATANGAVSVNTAQQTQINSIITVNNTQNTRLDTLESEMDVVEGRLDVIETIDIPAIDGRLYVLEYGGVWAWFHDMLISANGYTSTNGQTYTIGVGWQSNSNGINLLQAVAIRENQITHMECIVVYNAAPTGNPEWRANGGEWGEIGYNGIGVESRGWIRMHNQDSANLQVDFAGSGDFVLKALRYLGRGSDNPFD